MLDVIEKNDNIVTFKGKIIQMKEEEQKKTKGNNKKNAYTYKKIKKKFLSFLSHNIVSALVLAVLVYYFHDLPESVVKLEKDMVELKAKMEILDENYSILNSQIWSVNQNNSAQNSKKEESVFPTESILASESFSYETARVYSTGENIMNSAGNVDYVKDDEVIGISVHTQIEVTKEFMENKPFIINYKENGEDVFFYGRYNEEGKWDGDCIINRYKDSKLSFIMEATYDSGTLKNYQQVFKGKNLLEQEIWYVSDREVEGSENSGETWSYFCYGDYEKELDIESVTENDIMSIEDFCKTIPSTIEGYYNGYTSNGKYNDNKGDAYLVKYKPNGDVRYLYKGKIKNGLPEDDSGTAWAVSWGYADDGWYYYKGKFSEGKHETPKNWKPEEQEKIDSIINPDDFNCPLTGLIAEK